MSIYMLSQVHKIILQLRLTLILLNMNKKTIKHLPLGIKTALRFHKAGV